MVKLRIKVNDEEYDELVAYNEMNDFIDWHVLNDDGTWRFCKILTHKGPLNSTHEDFMGSKYNVLIKWETSEHTWEPTDIF